MKSEEGVSLQRQWHEVQSSLVEFMKKVVEEWRSLASADYTKALSQPILCRRLDTTIAVNFSSEVQLGFSSYFKIIQIFGVFGQVL